jgi:hypothetical protein
MRRMACLRSFAQVGLWASMLSRSNVYHCQCAQDIASPDEEWVEGVHAATQAAQEDLLISNTRLIGSGQGAYDASRMSTVRQLRMLVSPEGIQHSDPHAACTICNCGNLTHTRRHWAVSFAQLSMPAFMTSQATGTSDSAQHARGIVISVMWSGDAAPHTAPM